MQHGYLLHRSGPNRSSTRYRRALVNHYMSAQSLLPWGQEFGQVGRGDNRAVHMVCGADPYHERGYQRPRSIHSRLSRRQESA
ncbi:MAG: hypothetical protein ACOCXJ_09645 [Planctomycetota bacterium]